MVCRMCGTQLSFLTLSGVSVVGPLSASAPHEWIKVSMDGCEDRKSMRRSSYTKIHDNRFSLKVALRRISMSLMEIVHATIGKSEPEMVRSRRLCRLFKPCEMRAESWSRSMMPRWPIIVHESTRTWRRNSGCSTNVRQKRSSMPSGTEHVS